MNGSPLSPPLATAPRRPGWRFLFSHVAHPIALGFGSGLSPIAPGTVGTLWAWVAFVVLQPHLTSLQWALLIVASLVIGVWACTQSARHLGVADPSAVVWDEIVAFWIVLWLVMPASFWSQLVAFALFRFFDAAKPGPVAWADALFKVRRGQPIGWAQGFGILFDDLVAALCTLVVIALWRFL
ncbi:MAG TPA: phosphatidylglycerophosphatase A [Burkholderiaceae bacterium]|nr:phosphatidylglycerophosphatase A [Burkholderiaceae bacterium]